MISIKLRDEEEIYLMIAGYPYNVWSKQFYEVNVSWCMNNILHYLLYGRKHLLRGINEKKKRKKDHD